MYQRRPGFFSRALRRERGAVFLETALVMPVFIAMLCFCVDFPRLLTFQQRLVGVNRLVAEVKARNGGDFNSVMSPKDLQKYFFKDMSLSGTPNLCEVKKKGSVLYCLSEIVTKFLGKFMASLAKALMNIVSMGNFGSYFGDVIEGDHFHGAYVTVEVATIMPPSVYRGWIGSNTGLASGKKLSIGSRYVCYMPNCDAFVQRNYSWFGTIKYLLKHWKLPKKK